MIIHAYLTDGFYGWGELFLKSFKLYHGEEHKVFLCTRDLTESQIGNLKTLYSNIHVSNKKLDFGAIAERARLTVPELKVMKNCIENEPGAVKLNFLWKQAISVEDRNRNSITEDYLIHFDIDMYFRKNLQELFDHIKNRDITIKFRFNKSEPRRKVMGGLIGFKICEKTRQFMDCWVHHIDAKPLYEKPIGYGQSSFWFAYCDMKNEIHWGDIELKYISNKFLDTDIIWSANTGRQSKQEILELCKQDLMRNI
jgi:hypothetical protein